ncbi:DUF2065 domain-containing protein [Roseobacter sp. AzwK-3b]|uniref:DUF2065 domain-containing protein n=1 Tax=Roseobacter sp. AzwK-3b TaxID=351016 RepID=UPI0005627F4C|nr:DUF2065 domain-containing protein [Roseobacter sp. AzwK-3b]
METLLLALGLVLIVEGLVYALAPSLLERMLLALTTLSEEQRRLMGLIALALGVAMVWAAKTLGA